MIKFIILSTVGVMTWLYNISLANGRLLEFSGCAVGLGLMTAVIYGWQMNKREPVNYYDPYLQRGVYLQEKLAFALALRKYLPAAELEAQEILNDMLYKYHMIPNNPYIKDVMNWYLKNLDWDVFVGRAQKEFREIYVN